MVNQNSINLLLGTISVVAIILAVIAIFRKSKDNFSLCNNNCQAGNSQGSPPNTYNQGTGNVPVVAKDSLSLLATDSNGNLSTVTVMPIGSIIMWPSQNAIPDGWFWCDGGTYTVGSDKITVPDMRGRFPVGADLYANGGPQQYTSIYGLGDVGGEEMHLLQVGENLSYNPVWNNFAPGSGPIGSPFASMGAASLPHNNLPPFFGIGFIIKLSHY